MKDKKLNVFPMRLVIKPTDDQILQEWIRRSGNETAFKDLETTSRETFV